MKTKSLMVRVSEEEKSKIESKTKNFGFVSLSEYLHYLGLNCESVEIKLVK